MTTELATIAARVQDAVTYLDVFGQSNGDTSELPRHIKRTYRGLSKVLHPDKYRGSAQEALAAAAFARLNDLLRQAEQAVRQGTYGQPAVLAVVSTRKAEHHLARSLGGGDICDLYLGTSVLATGKQTTVTKIAGDPRDNDLLQTEAAALRRLRATNTDATWHPYFPELIDSFAYREAGRPQRHANVLNHLRGFYSLEQVRRAFPSGVNPLDMAWMWRRLLVAMGYAHDQGIVHGAVLPGHVMILPEQHGLVLIDWCYASIAQDGIYPAITALAEPYEPWYPKEVTDRQPPGPATDIMLAARTCVYLLGGDPITGRLPATVPPRLRAFLGSCLMTAPESRPDNAWNLLAEFDQLLERMGSPYFPRRFRAFTMP